MLLIVTIFIAIYVVNETIIKRQIEKENAPDPASFTLCPPTQKDSEGPYYISGTPYTDQLAPPNIVGDKLIVKGKITQTDCRTPLADTTLDIWHADANGDYDNTWYRGKVRVDDEGNYQFETIQPSGYSSGIIRRLPHIHFKVFKDGRELLTSQMYFEKTVEIAESQVINLGKQNQVLTGTFNIIINP